MKPPVTTTTWTCARCGFVTTCEGTGQPKNWSRFSFATPPLSAEPERGGVSQNAEYEFPDAFLNARVKLWFCPLDAEHRKAEQRQNRPIVEWDGDRATCLVCGRHNDGSGAAK